MEAHVKRSGGAWRLKSKCAIQARPREYAGQQKKGLPGHPRAWRRHDMDSSEPFMADVPGSEASL